MCFVVSALLTLATLALYAADVTHDCQEVSPCYEDGLTKNACEKSPSRIAMIPWREHPDGIRVSPGVTEDDLGFLMSNLLLGCGEYVSEVSLENQHLHVIIGTKERRSTRGYIFAKSESGVWEIDSYLSVTQATPNKSLQPTLDPAAPLAVAKAASASSEAELRR